MNSRFGALVSRMRTQRALSTLVILLTLAVGILIGTVLSRGRVRGNSGSRWFPAAGDADAAAAEQHVWPGGYGR